MKIPHCVRSINPHLPCQPYLLRANVHSPTILSSYFQLCFISPCPLLTSSDLFDKRFGEKSPHLLSHYKVPIYFQRDFYSWLPQDVPVKPSFRWWLIGPAKSGSSFHKV